MLMEKVLPTASYSVKDLILDPKHAFRFRNTSLVIEPQQVKNAMQHHVAELHVQT
jgi:hypothetical protein